MAGDLKIDTAGIGGLISGIGSAAKDIRAAITGKSVIDPTAQAEIENKLLQMETDLALAQNNVNAIEAANPKLFVSGWRPFIGWVAGISLGCYYIPRSIASIVFWVIACINTKSMQPMADIGITDLLGLLGSMLGFATLRTVEKAKGVAAK